MYEFDPVMQRLRAESRREALGKIVKGGAAITIGISGLYVMLSGALPGRPPGPESGREDGPGPFDETAEPLPASGIVRDIRVDPRRDPPRDIDVALHVSERGSNLGRLRESFERELDDFHLSLGRGGAGVVYSAFSALKGEIGGPIVKTDGNYVLMLMDDPGDREAERLRDTVMLGDTGAEAAWDKFKRKAVKQYRWRADLSSSRREVRHANRRMDDISGGFLSRHSIDGYVKKMISGKAKPWMRKVVGRYLKEVINEVAYGEYDTSIFDRVVLMPELSRGDRELVGLFHTHPEHSGVVMYLDTSIAHFRDGKRLSLKNAALDLGTPCPPSKADERMSREFPGYVFALGKDPDAIRLDPGRYLAKHSDCPRIMRSYAIDGSSRLLHTYRAT